MRLLFRNNFLHYGDSLECLGSSDFSQINGQIKKNELIRFLLRQNRSSKYLTEIVSTYGGRRKKKIDVSDFRKDLENSLKVRRTFKELKCRGFSYHFFDKMAWFPFRLRKEINLRLALMTGPCLFYPPRVKDRLTSAHRYTHYWLDNYPCIAFALGSKIEKSWYILVIQSDLVFRKPAALREHFRGWRKVLF